MPDRKMPLIWFQALRGPLAHGSSETWVQGRHLNLLRILAEAKGGGKQSLKGLNLLSNTDSNIKAHGPS